MYRTAKPWPLLYCQNRIPPAFQTTDDPTWEAAKTIGKRSLWAMDKGSCNGDHLPTNQSLLKIAPYPTEPAASEKTWRSGMGAQRGDNRKLYPFHDWKNLSHHDKSKWNFLLSLIGRSSLRKAKSKLIIRRRKVRPEGMTLHACWRLPIKDSSSFRVQWPLSDQETRSMWIRSNFSCGRRACNSAIGESRVLCLKRSGEWKSPPTCQDEEESPNPGIAGYKCLSSVGTSEN